MKPILKLKVYSVKDKMPKLRPVFKNSLIKSSSRVIIYWEWVNSSFGKEEPRLGTYNEHSETRARF